MLKAQTWSYFQKKKKTYCSTAFHTLFHLELVILGKKARLKTKSFNPSYDPELNALPVTQIAGQSVWFTLNDKTPLKTGKSRDEDVRALHNIQNFRKRFDNFFSIKYFGLWSIVLFLIYTDTVFVHTQIYERTRLCTV